MDQQELRTLKLLSEVSRNDRVSQRDLARQLGVSLGLVNSFVKRLVSKGYFKITTIPRNRLRYVLTPRGMAEKSRLTLSYVRHSINFYTQIKQMWSAALEGLAGRGMRRVMIWGAGEVAEIAYLLCGLHDLEVVGVVSPGGGEKSFLGRRPLTPTELKEADFDLVLVADLDQMETARDGLMALGVAADQIVLPELALLGQGLKAGT